MLSKGSRKHVQWPPYSGGSDHLRCGGGPVRPVYGWPRRGEDLCPVRHILGNWCQWALAPAGFFSHPTPRNTDGPAGLARWPFS